MRCAPGRYNFGAAECSPCLSGEVGTYQCTTSVLPGNFILWVDSRVAGASVSWGGGGGSGGQPTTIFYHLAYFRVS